MIRSVPGLLALVVALLAAACAKTGNADAALEASVSRGEKIYKQYCLTCHQADGGGASRMNPPLIKTSYVLGAPDKLIPGIIQGMSGQEIDGEQYQNIMPPFSFLTDREVADVLTYVRNNFANKAPMVTESDVKAVRDGLGMK